MSVWRHFGKQGGTFSPKVFDSTRESERRHYHTGAVFTCIGPVGFSHHFPCCHQCRLCGKFVQCTQARCSPVARQTRGIGSWCLGATLLRFGLGCRSPWAVAGCDAEESINGHGLLHEQRPLPNMEVMHWIILDPLDSGHWTSSDLVNLKGLQGDMAEHLSISPLPFANFAMPWLFPGHSSLSGDGLIGGKGRRDKGIESLMERDWERERELERKRQLRQLLDAFGL